MSVDRRPEPDVPAVSPPGRVAVVGAGGFGRFSIDAYRKAGDVQVITVADPNGAALQQVRAPGVRLEQDWRRVVQDDAVEAVHLATPPFARGEIVLAALRAGKSVFCEKPLALSLEEADAMIAAARSSDVALGVDYVMRHHPAYRLLERLAASGLFGSLRSIAFTNSAQSLPPDHWFWDRSLSGGIFVEHGVHFFDAYGRIAGPPERVWGSAPRREAVEATVVYRSGVVGRFYHEFAFNWQVERATGASFFERGYVEIEGWIPTRLSGSVLAPPDALHDFPELGPAQDGDVLRFSMSYPDRQGWYAAAVVAGMRDVILRHRDPSHRMVITPEEARADLALALACREAASTGRPAEVRGADPSDVTSSL